MLCLLAFLAPVAARAQLARSFYNITGIETKVLPNAVRITIQTDGDAKLGVDVKEFATVVGTSSDDFYVTDALPKTSLRLRFAGARQKIPAFTEIGAYPVDSAVVRLSRDKLAFPLFEDGSDPTQDGSGTPGVDLEIRLYVPIKVTYFTLRFDRYYPGWTLSYPAVLNPLEASIVVAPDNRSVVITVMTDRVETARNEGRLRRSPPEGWRHRLAVTGDAGRMSVDALHATLGETLTEIARVSGLSLEAQPDAVEADVSSFLPESTPEASLRSLTRGLGLTLTARTPTEGGGYLVGRFGTSLLTERLPVRNIAASLARSLFPDVLLPYLHVDTEGNALIATGSPALIARLRHDIAVVDRPSAQVRVEAQAYELSYPEEAAFVISGAVDDGRVGWDGDAGQITVALKAGQQKSVRARLQALITKGRAWLAARPELVVTSGKTGTLFIGQTRYITIRVNNYGGTTATILPLMVGTTLKVTPTTSGEGGAVLLDLQPNFSTVDSIEAGTGLPTLGIRQVNSLIRVQPGDSVLIGGLEERTSSRARNAARPFDSVPFLKDVLASRHDQVTRVSLVIFVSARIVEDAPRPKEKNL